MTGIEAMMPGDRLEGALRLLWEIIKSKEGGRCSEYREKWTSTCKFPAKLFDSTLGSLPEFTTSEWQVMFDGIRDKVLPICMPVKDHILGPAAAPSYIEHFLNVCMQLNQGSTDSSKATRIAHPHTEKVQVLAGIFAQMDVLAAM